MHPHQAQPCPRHHHLREQGGRQGDGQRKGGHMSKVDVFDRGMVGGAASCLVSTSLLTTGNPCCCCMFLEIGLSYHHDRTPCAPRSCNPDVNPESVSIYPPAAASSSAPSAPGSSVAKPLITSSSPTFITAAVPCTGKQQPQQAQQITAEHSMESCTNIRIHALTDTMSETAALLQA
jgi:hypothetical protein